MNWGHAVLIGWICIIVGIFAGAALRDVGNNFLKSDCAREHNVYACELIAMPIDPFHPEEN